MDGDPETGQVAFTMETRELRVVMADESHLDALGELIRAAIRPKTILTILWGLTVHSKA